MERVWVEGSKEKLHQANEEGATDLLKTSSQKEISKSSTPASTPTWHAVRCRVGNWTLSFWAHLLTGQMENSTSSEKTYWGRSGVLPALHRFRARMGRTLRLDHVKYHGLYSEMGWQVSFQQLETLLQKYYPRKPAQEEALGGDILQKRDLTHTDEPDLIPLYSFEEAGQPIRGPTTEQDEQLGAAQTDDEDSAEGGAAHRMEVEDEGERYAPYTFDVRPRPLQTTDGVPAPRQRRIWTRVDAASYDAT